MGSSTIISPDAQYVVMLTLAYVTDMLPSKPRLLPFTLDGFVRSDIAEAYGITRDDAKVILREAIARTHARVDALGCYTLTEAGEQWLRVESEIRKSVDEARKRAGEGAS